MLRLRRGRGRGNAKPGRPPKPPVQQKSVTITPFADFIRENPTIFADVFDADGKPRTTLHIDDGRVPSVLVEEISVAKPKL
jgi:hypothetical protein